MIDDCKLTPEEFGKLDPVVRYDIYCGLLKACKDALGIESQIGPRDSIIGPNYRLIETLRAAIAKAERSAS